jgi:hypothetical protein
MAALMKYEDFLLVIAASPYLDTLVERRYTVKRVGSVGRLFSGAGFFFETTDGEFYRIPEGRLWEWAMSTIMLARRFGTMFPCEVEFGHIDGRDYAELY